MVALWNAVAPRARSAVIRRALPLLVAMRYARVASGIRAIPGSWRAASPAGTCPEPEGRSNVLTHVERRVVPGIVAGVTFLIVATPSSTFPCRSSTGHDSGKSFRRSSRTRLTRRCTPRSGFAFRVVLEGPVVRAFVGPATVPTLEVRKLGPDDRGMVATRDTGCGSCLWTRSAGSRQTVRT